MKDVYPIKFDKCPVCGSTRCIVEEEVNKEIEAGNLKEGSKIPALISQSKMFDPNSNITIFSTRHVTVLIGFYDVCTDCGTLYCKEMQKQVAVVKPYMKKIS